MRALLVLGAVLVAGCAGPEVAAVDVLSTVYPVHYLADRLAPPDLTRGLLVPGGVEPHAWEPAPADVLRVDRAGLVLAQGAGFDAWLDPMLATLGADAPPVRRLADGLDLREGHDEAHEEEEDSAHAADPHTWLDPLLFATQSDAAAAALVAHWPEHANAVIERAAALRRDLEELDRDMAAGLADCDVRVVVANHDAYGYLAARYGFEVVAVSGLSPEAEPDPAAVARVVDVVREHNLTVVFFEELVARAVVEAIARDVGATTRVLSPVEGVPPGSDADYLTLMRDNLANLREGMRCR